MKRIIWLYGIALAVLVTLLKRLEYRYHLRDLSVEFYIGLVAVLFTAIGVWVGLKLTHTMRKQSSGAQNATPGTAPQDTQQQLERLSISSREYEVLQLIAAGHSNQEIADRLFISLNTVKTHSSNLFSKMNVRRRTQAVQRAKELGIIV